jgi:hypothetical protein
VLSVTVISVPGGIRASHQLETSSTRNVAYWHFSDLPILPANVGYEG